jgi:3-oxoacyl-(acyl-carrier-protein) synthase
MESAAKAGEILSRVDRYEISKSSNRAQWTEIDESTITPTAASHTIEIAANGTTQTVTSGNASSAISLGSAGTMTEVTVKVYESGKAAKTYKFWCVRAAS